MNLLKLHKIYNSCSHFNVSQSLSVPDSTNKHIKAPRGEIHVEETKKKAHTLPRVK